VTKYHKNDEIVFKKTRKIGLEQIFAFENFFNFTIFWGMGCH
jgi:hypothetical protein